MHDVIDALQEQYASVLDFAKRRKKGADEVVVLLSQRITAEVQYSKAMQGVSSAQLALNEGYLFWSRSV